MSPLAVALIALTWVIVAVAVIVIEDQLNKRKRK